MALRALVVQSTRRPRSGGLVGRPPLRVFLSHTSELQRVPSGRSFVQAAEDAVRRAGHALVDMAYFSACDASPASYCMREMARVNVYVGIIGHQYGSSVREQPELSYTELEFETATALGLPRLILFVDPSPQGDAIDIRQQRFRRRLRETAVTTATVTTPDELALHLYQSLAELRTAEESLTPAAAPSLVRPLVGALLGGIIAAAVITRAPPASAGLGQVAGAAVIGVVGAMGCLALGALSDVALRWLSRAPGPYGPPVEDALQRRRYRARVREIVMRIASEHRRSISTAMRIEPALAERWSAVDDPLPVVVHPRSEPDRSLEPGTSIGTVFDQLHGQILILGAPGAGKTTTLVELAVELLSDSRRPDLEPTPVVFNLASWTPRSGTLADWLVGELSSGYDVPTGLGHEWVAANQIIPLLDGLDEVPMEHRDACVSAINHFRRAHGRLPLVVCSRVREYEELRSKLSLRGALVVQPLSPEEVDTYLRRAGAAGRARTERAASTSTRPPGDGWAATRRTIRRPGSASVRRCTDTPSRRRGPS